MCQVIDPMAVEAAQGYFDKRGDGNPQHFPVLVALCKCGTTYWARVPSGVVWVEAEKEENREPTLDAATEFSQEAAQCRGS